MAPFGASGPTLNGIFAYSPATGLWSAKVTFPQNFPTGEWGVMGLLLVDWVGNMAHLTPVAGVDEPDAFGQEAVEDGGHVAAMKRTGSDSCPRRGGRGGPEGGEG